MILKRITYDHYVVVDDSEIKEDCYALHEGPLGEREIVTANGQCKLDKKITHSTIPKGMMLMEGIKRLSLQEVKELIREVDVDVEKKASEYAVDDFDDYAFCGYIKGYNQALEDNKEKKYTEEDMRKAMNLARIGAYDMTFDSFDNIIYSLEPKTEWEVEFDENGKLKLK